jgi:uncharacterized protein (TIGR03437 family)
VQPASLPYSGFLALLDNYTVTPPDANGAVGPNDVVSMLNSEVLIQSRSGKRRPYYPISLNWFWAATGDIDAAYDPRILYDAQADRWVASAAVFANDARSAMLLGVSRTGDPGGEWNLYRLEVGASGTWADFPVLGVNPNWVALSVNRFNIGGGQEYVRTDLYAFSKAALYAGRPLSYRTFSDPEGSFAPATGVGSDPDSFYFVQSLSGRPGVIRVSELRGPVGAETFSAGKLRIEVGDGWDGEPYGSVDFGPQTGSFLRVDTGDDRIQNCQQRGGSIWCAHTVFVPAGNPTRAAAQWFEIDPAAARLVQLGRVEDPGNFDFYAFPSIAANSAGDALIGFTHFSAGAYPSAAFAYRAAADAPGAMRAPTDFKNGEAPYIAPISAWSPNRWGDYSVTLVDPADGQSFWTFQEYAATPTDGVSGRWGVWWARTPAPSAAPNCVYALSETRQAVGTEGGAVSVTVSAPAGCPWMAASKAPWITVGSGSPAEGSGALAYTVSPNPDATADRSATLVIAGQTLTVTQAAGSMGGAPSNGIDLAVTSMTAPTTALSGAYVSITARVENRSALDSGPFRIGIYLGSGSSVSAADARLAECATEGLASLSAATCSRTVALPWGANGNYVIGAVADYLNQTPDPDRSNNTRMAGAGPITITLPALPPRITAAGVTNAASFLGRGIAPGEMVTIFGSNLGAPTLQYPSVNGAGVVDRIAGGTRVYFNGVAAPMVYAIDSQVTAVAPFTLSGSATVQVESLGNRSNTVTVPVVPATLAIFTRNGSGSGPGAVLNENYSINSPANPAKRGSWLTIFATGGGAMQQPQVDGVLGGPPWIQLAQPVTARLGNAPAQVMYAGNSSGIIVGALQINVIVPLAAPSGPAVPLILTVGGVSSPTGVTVAIE